MRVLVACEYSGTVRDAFRAGGHDAVSCDLLPTDVPGPHIVGDVVPHLTDGWDLLIAHPPCTYLCSSGLHWNHRTPGRDAKTADALRFVLTLMGEGGAHSIPKIALENPVGRISTAYRKADQTIQPWQFGHPDSKATCLWLKGLPPLRPTDVLSRPAWIRCECCDDFLCTIHGRPGEPIHAHDCKCPSIASWARRGLDPYTEGGRWDNQTPSGQNKLGPSADRWKIRSATYKGIAAAMAEQWGGAIVAPVQGELL
jgi:hypothetical protein